MCICKLASDHPIPSPLPIVAQVRIPLASLEDEKGAKRVEEDRSTTIEAAVVRIMKVRPSATPSSIAAAFHVNR